MSDNDHKAVLHDYLRIQRAVMLDKLDGLSERQARMPMTGTGTNILGVIKHTVSVEAGYLGEVFGRPFPQPLPWFAEDAEDNADMWATAEQDIPWIREFCQRVWSHGDATILALDLDTAGSVPWWRNPEVTLQRILVHVIAEYARHDGHLDIVREQLDGVAGYRPQAPNLPPGDATWWQDYVARLTALAEQFDDTAS